MEHSRQGAQRQGTDDRTKQDEGQVSSRLAIPSSERKA